MGWGLGLALGPLGFLLAPLSGLAAPPANDTCAGAVVIPTASFPYLTPLLTNMHEATLAGDPLPSCVGGAVRGVWYQITPTQSGLYSFSTGSDTATTAFDTILSVFADPGCGAVTNQIACNDDAGAGNTLAGLLAPLNQGTHYYVIVWVSGADTNTSNLTLQLRVDRPALPSNDTCATAEVIAANRGYPQKSSLSECILAGSEAGGPSCVSGYRSVWYKFTPTNSGTYIFSTGIDTATTVFDTVMVLYSGSCGNLTELVCSDAGEARGSILRTLTGGTSYYIAIFDESPELVVGETTVQLSIAVPTAPSVTTLPPGSISSSSVTLGGLVNPNGLQSRFWFEWGTTAFNRTSQIRLLFPGIIPVETNVVLTGFLPNTTYQYRMVGTNQSGRTIGATNTFVWSTNGPRLDPLEVLISGNNRVTFTGNPFQGYFVDTSTNLITWTNLGPAIETPIGSGVFIFNHPAARGPDRRFYRITSP